MDKFWIFFNWIDQFYLLHNANLAYCSRVRKYSTCLPSITTVCNQRRSSSLNNLGKSTETQNVIRFAVWKKGSVPKRSTVSRRWTCQVDSIPTSTTQHFLRHSLHAWRCLDNCRSGRMGRCPNCFICRITEWTVYCICAAVCGLRCVYGFVCVTVAYGSYIPAGRPSNRECAFWSNIIWSHRF